MPPRIATFGSLRDDNQNGGEDDGDRNEYYAGGHASGVAVAGGPNSRPNPSDRSGGVGLGNLFEQFRNSIAANQNPDPVDEGSEADIRSVTLTIWRGNVFSIDDGESEIVPRDPSTDPAAAAFIAEVQSGRVPAELRLKWGNNVDVNVENRNTDEFEVKKRPMKAFSGAGRRLGDVVPSNTIADTTAIAPASVPADNVPSADPILDEAKPVTKVQIRLGDGTRLVARFNPTHTVADLRDFVSRSTPGQNRSFVFMTTFPKKVVDDESQTLEQAKLCGAAVIQKYT